MHKVRDYLIIVGVQLGAMEIYVASVEALRKQERQDETQFTEKIDCFLSFIPRRMLMYFFAGFFLNLTLVNFLDSYDHKSTYLTQLTKERTLGYNYITTPKAPTQI
jgi:hypothetical protein